MDKTILFTCLASLLCFTCTQQNEKLFPDEKAIAEKMDSAMSNSDLPAVVAMAINKNGETVSYNYGKVVWSEDKPVTPNNIFRIYSMTKLITSIAALQLVESGKLNLDDDLSALMPGMDSIPILSNGHLTKANNKITLRHLLTHTSGFGYPYTDRQLATFDTTNWKYEDLPRRFESGTQFLYGTSTDWAGKLVEKASGLSLEDYFRKNITGPLKMDRTWFNVPDSLKSEIVSFGWRGDNGKSPLTEIPARIPQKPVTEFSGGDGLFSSPSDYINLLKCLLNNGKYEGGQLFNAETFTDMCKNHIGEINMHSDSAFSIPAVCCNMDGLFSNTTKWGLAFMIDNEPKNYGRKAGTIFWGGAANTFSYLDQESGISAAIFTQHFPFNHKQTTSLFDRFSEIIYTNYSSTLAPAN